MVSGDGACRRSRWSSRRPPRAPTRAGPGPRDSRGCSSRWSSAGPLEPVLPQAIYGLDHDALGHLDLFLVPIGPGGGRDALPGGVRLTVRALTASTPSAGRRRGPRRPRSRAARRAGPQRLWASTWMLTIRPSAAASCCSPAISPAPIAAAAERRQQRDVDDPQVAGASVDVQPPGGSTVDLDHVEGALGVGPAVLRVLGVELHAAGTTRAARAPTRPGPAPRRAKRHRPRAGARGPRRSPGGG